MKSVDSVPNTTPIVITREKLNKVPWPMKIIGIRTIKVVADVKIVLDKVVFSDLMTTCFREVEGFSFRSSLTLSKTIIVSFKEYPMIVRIAASELISRFTGTLK